MAGVTQHADDGARSACRLPYSARWILDREQGSRCLGRGFVEVLGGVGEGMAARIGGVSEGHDGPPKVK